MWNFSCRFRFNINKFDFYKDSYLIVHSERLELILSQLKHLIFSNKFKSIKYISTLFE
jgi:hypothetical protein